MLQLLGVIVVLAGACGLYLSTVTQDHIRVDLEMIYLLGTNISGKSFTY